MSRLGGEDISVEWNSGNSYLECRQKIEVYKASYASLAVADHKYEIKIIKLKMANSKW